MVRRYPSLAALFCFFFTLCSLLRVSTSLTLPQMQPIRIVLKPLPSFISRKTILHLECCPLMGGPPFLPLHVQVVVENDHKFDFVPQDATNAGTVLQLMSFQSVPGDLRYLSAKKTKGSVIVEKARDFTENYSNDNLHLLNNNCWSFAWKLLQHLNEEQEVIW